MQILILCTGNSCRSQMAQGILQSFSPDIQVFSAGTKPTENVHPKAIDVMQEIDIDMINFYPKTVSQFLNQEWDYVITVCGDAKDTCPIFLGKVNHQVHIGFTDPANAKGSDEEILNEFRKIRDEIKRDFLIFYNEKIK